MPLAPGGLATSPSQKRVAGEGQRRSLDYRTTSGKLVSDSFAAFSFRVRTFRARKETWKICQTQVKAGRERRL